MYKISSIVQIVACIFFAVIQELYFLIQFSGRFERLLNEMLSHLERQPRNKECRIAWLELIEPLLNAVGLVLLAHFRRLFPLLFQWMHADDDETVLLVRNIDAYMGILDFFLGVYIGQKTGNQ